MNVHEKKKLVTAYYARMDQAKGDFTQMNDLFNDDMQFHFPGIPTPLPVSGFQEPAQAIYAGFNDFTHIVEELILEEDKLACRLSITGTHTGEFQGVPATGKPVAINAITTFRLTNGKLSEHWVSVDMLGLMAQIGALPN